MKSKALMGHAFIKAMIDAGLLPNYTTYVHIAARVGDVVTMDYSTMAEENLLAVVPGIETIGDAGEPEVVA